MPDMTMCCNYKCPLKAKCYRYRAVPDGCWQSFAFFKPKDGVCEYFWRVDELAQKTLSVEVVDNRYERDESWKGLEYGISE